ncbi:hemerythrin domain-containing protein [Ideonella sp. BN130291]|uniref:hemerythrin domain-containing protein n=1 Tax=Ideonella sp. BN130291 TaxID=3112940 RepID=UPI002E25FEF6|nr:hemerythrin domain-containing protein [Ideonella sp. BN130291]
MPRPSAFPGLHSPAAGFDQPFDMLAACHDRVRRSLALLERLLPHLQAHGPDAQARDAARDVLRYFDMAAPAHHEDEERHVIPLLLGSSNAELQAAAQRMLADHHLIREGWARLAPLLRSVTEGQPVSMETLQPEAIDFVRLHHAHLDLEDTLAFPHAHQHLGHDQAAVQAMGAEMAARRGVRTAGG